MKNSILFFGFLLLSVCSQAQQAYYSWHEQFPGSNIMSVSTMSNGDVLTHGDFWGIIDFDPDPVVAHYMDVTNGRYFFARKSADGQYIWAVNFDSLATLSVEGMVVDEDDNILIAGSFYGTADMAPGPAVYLIQATQIDVFFAKYSGQDGHLICAKTFGSTQQDHIGAICGDRDGNILLTGSFYSPINVDPNGSYILTTGGFADIYVAKYDSTGQLITAAQISSASGDQSSGIITDNSNAVYVTGYVQDSADVDPGAGVYKVPASMFLMKMDENFNFQKAVAFYGNGYPSPRQMIIDANSDLVIAGEIRSPNGVDFDGSAGTAIVSSQSLGDAFITRQDTGLNYISAIDIEANTVSQPWGLSTDPAGNVYASFYFQGDVDVDPGPGVVSYTSLNNSSDILLAKYSPQLQLLWSYSMGSNGTEFGFDIAAGQGNKFYACGYFSQSIDAEPGSSQVILTSSSTDGYLICYNQCLPQTYTVPATICHGQDYIFGNDSLRTSGSFTQRFSSVSSCDSIVTLELTVVSPVIDLCLSDTTISSKAINASYQWINCTSNTPVSGATAQNFHVPDNNGYAVKITQSGCVDTSECMQLYQNGNRRVPEFAWGSLMPYQMFGGAHAMRIGRYGDIYVSGEITDIANFNLLSGPDYSLSAVDNHRYFCLAKYNENREYQWAFACGAPVSTGPYPEVVITAMELDSTDNIYVAGYYRTAFDCDPGSGVTMLPDNTLQNTFLAKYTTSGQLIWANYMENAGGFTEINSIFTDNSGHVYLGGNATGTISINTVSGTASATVSGLHCLMLMQFNSATGAYGWNFIPPAGTFGDCDVSGGACDPAGNIIFSGYFSLQIDFDPDTGTTNLTPAVVGANDAFLVKFTPNRQLVWAKKRNSICDYTSPTSAYSVLTDCDSNVYWSGTCLGAFISKYSSNGTLIQNYPISSERSYGRDLAMDEMNNLYFQINYYDSCHTGTDTFYANNGSEALFCKFRNDGRYDWAARLYNPDRDDQATTIDVDRKGNIYTLGNFSDTIDVDASNAVYNLTAPSGFHVYLVKYGEGCAPVDTALSGDSTLLSGPDTCSWYQWMDCTTGQIVPGANQSSIQPLNAGFYRAIIYQGECVDTSGCHYMAAFNSMDEKYRFDFSVWPNPVSSDQLEIRSEYSIQSVELYNVNGMKVFSDQQTNRKKSFSIYTVDLSDGVYYLKVLDDHGRRGSKKIVVMR